MRVFRVLMLLALICPSLYVCSQPIKFQRTYGTTNMEYIDAACPTSDGGYIICYSTYSPSAPFLTAQCILMKTDSSGAAQWTKTYTKPGFTTSGGPVIQTLDGGYLFRMQLYKNGNAMGLCGVKTDSNGDTLWVKYNFGSRFLQNPDSSYVAGGMSMAKYNSKGDYVWNTWFPGGTGGDFNVTKDKGYISFGLTKKYAVGGPGDFDFYLIKSDSLGKMQWNKTYGLTGGTYHESDAWGLSAGRSVIETQDGGYIMVGSTDACGAGEWDIVVIKTNSSGSLQWSYTYGGIHLDYPTSIRQDKLGYILTGTTQGGAESTTPQNSERTFLAKLDLSGNLVWAMMYGSVFTNPLNAGDYCYSARPVIGPGGGYMLAGYTKSMGDPEGDIWLIKTDGNGISGCNEKPVIFSTKIPPFIIGSAGNDSTLPAIQTVDSALVISNWFHNDSVLCPATPVTVNELSSTENITVYPNPSSGIFTIQSKELQIKTIEVFNAVGEQVRSLPNTSVIDISSEPEGIYFVRIKTGEGTINKKILLVK